ncbi:MAG: LysM domain-containing protein [bacterium]
MQYVVQPGDTLFKIASMFGTTISDIQKTNDLK